MESFMELIISFDVRQLEEKDVDEIRALYSKHSQSISINNFLSWLNAVADIKEAKVKIKGQVMVLENLQNERCRHELLLRSKQKELGKSAEEAETLTQSVGSARERIASLESRMHSSSENPKAPAGRSVPQIELATEKPFHHKIKLKSPKRFGNEPYVTETNRDRLSESNIDTGGRISSTPRTIRKPHKKEKDDSSCKCNCL
eukprot:TRINITY_DN4140_c0_g1_i13.p1 TRINITY_DN4140_c0_g1~~TRINITY_DN4140_c0_g1_i13.p1  ORF type:complete len:202 (+),score=41.74 TRINITY_DN4140_c0_g1_i13:552-1157(+)